MRRFQQQRQVDHKFTAATAALAVSADPAPMYLEELARERETNSESALSDLILKFTLRTLGARDSFDLGGFGSPRHLCRPCGSLRPIRMAHTPDARCLLPPE